MSRGVFVVSVVRVLVTKPELLSRNSNYRTRVTASGGKKIIRIISVQLLVSFIFGDFFLITCQRFAGFYYVCAADYTVECVI